MIIVRVQELLENRITIEKRIHFVVQLPGFQASWGGTLKIFRQRVARSLISCRCLLNGMGLFTHLFFIQDIFDYLVPTTLNLVLCTLFHSTLKYTVHKLQPLLVSFAFIVINRGGIQLYLNYGMFLNNLSIFGYYQTVNRKSNLTICVAYKSSIFIYF